VFDQVGDAVGDDAGLAAAGAGKDQHRAFSSFDGFALLRVELVEKRQCGSGSGIADSILQGNGGYCGVDWLWPRPKSSRVIPICFIAASCSCLSWELRDRILLRRSLQSFS
jgi:hypothetical protein